MPRFGILLGEGSPDEVEGFDTVNQGRVPVYLLPGAGQDLHHGVGDAVSDCFPLGTACQLPHAFLSPLLDPDVGD